MRCGATLGVRILDVEAGGRTVADACIEVPPAQTLCGLGSVTSPTFFNIPAHRLRIEASAWRPEVLEADPELAGECPDGGCSTSAASRSRPSSRGQRSPAPPTSTPAATSMSPWCRCPAPTPTSSTRRSAGRSTPRPSGSPPTTSRPRSTSPASRRQPHRRGGQSREVPDGDGGSVYVIESGDTIPLEPVVGPIPSFAGETDKPLSHPARSCSSSRPSRPRRSPARLSPTTPTRSTARGPGLGQHPGPGAGRDGRRPSRPTGWWSAGSSTTPAPRWPT